MGLISTVVTFEQFQALPDQPGKHELLEGQLIEMPPAGFRHTRVQHRIFEALHSHLRERPHAATAFIEAGFVLGRESWLQPDVSLVLEEQIKAAGDFLEGAPHVAIEVISPSNCAETVDRKIRLYLDHGSREIWVFYPATRRVWLYAPDGSASEFRQQFSSPLLPGFALDLTTLFGQ